MFENALIVAAVGGLAVVMAAVVAFSRRTVGSLLVLAATVLGAVVLLAVERVVVTPREQLELAVEQIATAVEANDSQRVLALLADDARQVRSDAKVLMDLVEIDRCRETGQLRVEFAGDPAQATSATTRFKAFVGGAARQGGARIGFMDEVELVWVRTAVEAAWKIEGYTIYREGRAINAVEDARGIR